MLMLQIYVFNKPNGNTVVPQVARSVLAAKSGVTYQTSKTIYTRTTATSNKEVSYQMWIKFNNQNDASVFTYAFPYIDKGQQVATNTTDIKLYIIDNMHIIRSKKIEEKTTLPTTHTNRSLPVIPLSSN